MKNLYIKYLGFLVISALTLVAKTQTLPQKAETFTLNIPMANSADYLAKKSVTLKTGFSFKSDNNQTLKAAIDNTLTTSVQDGGNGEIANGLYSGFINTSGITTTAPPGTLPGNVDVSPSGAANYAIPLDVPKGVGGIAPQLAITYSSQAGDGLLGTGWNLAGISAVTRVGKSIYFDQINSPVNFTTTDRFALDGQRLIAPDATYGTGTCAYQKESTDFTEIKSYGSTAGNPDYFTVKTPDGSTIEYKFKVLVPGKTVTCMWLMTAITNRLGNSISYSYTDKGDGQFTLDEINYSVCKISFAYTTGENKTSYVGGVAFKQNLLLQSVTLTDNGVSREYSFTYNTYKLSEINYKKGSSLLCNPTTIIWETEDFNYTTTEMTDYGKMDNPYIVFGDFNGDGLMDVAEMTIDPQDKPGIIHSFKLSGISFRTKTCNIKVKLKGFNEKIITVTVPANYTENIDLTWWQRIMNSGGLYDGATSVNHTWDLHNIISTLNMGDGFTRITVNYTHYMEFEPNKGYSISKGYKYYYFKGDQLIESDNSSAFIGSSSHPAISRVSADFDADGLTESIDFADDAILSTTGLTVSQSQVLNEGDKYAIDFDGDGQLELFITSKANGVFQSLSYYIWKYNGSDFIQIANSSITCCNYWIKTLKFGDFNGDRISDLIIFDNNGYQWVLYFGTGTGYVKGTMPEGFDNSIPDRSGVVDLTKAPDFTLIAPNGHTENISGYPITRSFNHRPVIELADINNDGKTEILQSINNTSGFSSKIYFLNNDIFSEIDIPNADEMLIMDVDNDGQNEIIYSNFSYSYSPPTVVNAYVGYNCQNNWHWSFPTGQYIYEIRGFREASQDEINSFKHPSPEYHYENGNKLDYRAIWGPVGSKCGNNPQDNQWENTKVLIAPIKETKAADEKAPLSNRFILDINTNYRNSSISSITNGNGLTTSITNGVYTNNATIIKSTGTPITDLHIPMRLVKNIKTTSNDGTTTFAETNYNYTNLVIHDRRGVLCFTTITTDNITSLNKSVTTFDYDNTYFVSYPKKVDSYKGGLLVSTVTNTQLFVPKTGLKYFTYVSKTEQTNALTNNTNTTEFTIDTNNGHLTKQKVTFGTDGNVVTDYTIPTDNSTFGQPTKISTTRTQNGSFTSNQDLTYNTYGNVFTSTNNLGITTTYTYKTDNKSNVETVKSSADNLTTTYTYDATGRFVTNTKTPVGSNIYQENNTYDTEGNLVRTEDKNGLVKVFNYDQYGILKSTVAPNGNRTASSYGWCSADRSEIQTYTSAIDDMGNSITTYFDCLGRELRKITKPAQGKEASVDIYYNTNGTIDKQVSSVDGETKFTYGTYGRIETITAKGSTVSYGYSGNTTSTTINGVTTSKTTNAFGQVTKANDGGGDITYTYHPSGQVSSIKSVNTITTMGYNTLGQQISLIDPDAGTTLYTYENGKLKTQTNKMGNVTTITYIDGREVSKKIENSAKTLTRIVNTVYDPANHLGFVDYTNSYDMVTGSKQNEVKTSYTYDYLGQTTSITENIKGKDYTFNYEYDGFGRVIKTEYPSKESFTSAYTGSYLTGISEGVFSCNTIDGYDKWGHLTFYVAGGNNVINVYNPNGYLTSSTFGPASNRIKYEYDFDVVTQNLTSRSKTYLASNSKQTESFTYDNLDRLYTWDINSTQYNMNYTANGNIVQKSDMGLYAYNATQPHAVSSVTQLSGNAVSANTSDITYNLFGKVSSMTLKNTSGVISDNYVITYGPDDERRTSVLNGAETIYCGSYEVRPNGDQLHYISGPDGLLALLVTNPTTNSRKMYYLYTDYLGSLTAAMSADGSLYKEFNYDPWGRKRNPANWNDYETTASDPLFTIGFTGQEYIAAFALYNYNGRMYDPRLGRFLSPDNYVQAPDNSQSYNRYSYCLNNPLKYTDPSGYTWWSHFSGWVSETFDSFGRWLCKKNISVYAGINYSSGNGMTPYAGTTINGFNISTGYNVNNGWGIGSNNGSGFTNFNYPGINNGASEQMALQNIADVRRYYSDDWLSSSQIGYTDIRSFQSGKFAESNEELLRHEVPQGQGGEWHGAGGSWGDTDAFEGFWGGVNYLVTGGNIDGVHYFPDGMAAGPAPITGTVPLPGIGTIGTYAQMTKLTKGYKGFIQAHHLIETRFLKLFGLGKREAPAVIIDKVSHQIYTKQLLNELPRGVEHSPTDIINTYNRVYSSEPLWQQTIKMILGY